MAIIYSYPLKNTPVNDDLILISDSADKKKTKQITLGSIKRVTSIIAGSNITISSTGVGGTGDVTINSTGGGGGGGTAAGNTGDIQFSSGHPNQDFLNDTGFNFTTVGSDKILQLANTGFTNKRGVLKISGYFTSGEQVITTPASIQFLTQQPSSNPSKVVTLSSYATEDYNIKLPITGPGGNNKILESDTNGQLSWVNNTAFAEPGIFAGGGTPTLATGVTEAEIRNLIGAGTSSFSGAYNDLTGKPTIPTNNNQLTNGSGFVTVAANAVQRVITGGSGNSLIANAALIYDGTALVTSVNKKIQATRNNTTNSTTTNGIIELSNTSTGAYGFQSNIDSNSTNTLGNRHIIFRYNGGEVGYIRNASSNSVIFSTSASDKRKKKNIINWDEKVLEDFSLIEPKKFNYLNEEDSDKLTKGFIAQQMVDKFPEAYPKDADTEDEIGYYSFNPSGMTVYLMKAIKELKEEIDLLKNKIQILES